MKPQTVPIKKAKTFSINILHGALFYIDNVMHRGWKGIFNSFFKKFFSKSAYKDKIAKELKFYV